MEGSLAERLVRPLKGILVEGWLRRRHRDGHADARAGRSAIGTATPPRRPLSVPRHAAHARTAAPPPPPGEPPSTPHLAAAVGVVAMPHLRGGLSGRRGKEVPRRAWREVGLGAKVFIAVEIVLLLRMVHGGK